MYILQQHPTSCDGPVSGPSPLASLITQLESQDGVADGYSFGKLLPLSKERHLVTICDIVFTIPGWTIKKYNSLVCHVPCEDCAFSA